LKRKAGIQEVKREDVINEKIREKRKKKAFAAAKTEPNFS